VPSSEISSSYSYEYCIFFFIDSNGATKCLITAPAIMDVLKITPPFFYSYQCGSTLLTSYIPVHMYSISFQILLTIVSVTIIFSSSNRARNPPWLLSGFPGVCWPYHWHNSAIAIEKKPILIEPHQIITRTMNNIILLLSFGLCSPVLSVCIALSICVHLCSWLLLIDRFMSVRINRPTLNLQTADEVWEITEDPFARLLSEQLQGVHSSLLVCKWPVTLASCFFVTVLCWDMAGDKGGWLQAVWVPIVGVAMALVIGVCDHVLLSGAHTNWSWSPHLSSLFSSPRDTHPDNARSLELVDSSLHQSASLKQDETLLISQA
jgi:hypothetical protein